MKHNYPCLTLYNGDKTSVTLTNNMSLQYSIAIAFAISFIMYIFKICFLINLFLLLSRLFTYVVLQFFFLGVRYVRGAEVFEIRDEDDVILNNNTM